ncbi:hypothetical protein KSS87_001855 [Heliosperma pusillum]|nr:hypothetical protein KSS87_001855 [Heliosperma pusillum]
MSTPQCCENPPKLSPSYGEGSIENIGGLNTYVTLPSNSYSNSNSVPAILLISDVFENGGKGRRGAKKGRNGWEGKQGRGNGGTRERVFPSNLSVGGGGGWANNDPLRSKYNAKMAGMNKPIAKPKGSKKLKDWEQR